MGRQYSIPGFTALSDQVFIRVPILKDGERTIDLYPDHPRAVLIHGWGNGQPRNVQKYAAGYEALYPHSTQIVVLSPIAKAMCSTLKQRTKAMIPVVKAIFPSQESKVPSERPGQTDPVLVHTMSNAGGINYASTLYDFREIHNQPLPHYLLVLDSVPGCPYLTPKTLGTWSYSMAMGTARVACLPFIVMQFLWAIFLCVFRFFQWVVRIEPAAVFSVSLGINVEYETTEARRLYLYCREDRIVPYDKVVDNMTEATERRQNFVGSGYVRHMQTFPDQYWEVIQVAWTSAANCRGANYLSNGDDEMMNWSMQDSLLIGEFTTAHEPQEIGDHKAPVKVAAFDLDDTIIKTRSGKLYAQSPDDWAWWNEIVPSKLREAYDKGFTVRVITNQGRFTDEEGNVTPAVDLFKQKLEQICDCLNIPIVVYAACGNDKWRKPRTGIWELLSHGYQTNAREIDREGSYFVGDAAGRARDHTDVDFHFSLNIGVGFHTPEEFFLGLIGEAPGHEFDPASFFPRTLESNSFTGDTPANEELDLLLKECRETPVIVLVGAPGAGKSYFYNKFLGPLGYRHISLHKLGSQEDCIKEMENALSQGIPVVIDDINSTVQDRRPWLATAPKHNSQVSAIYFDLSFYLCLHNDAVRAFAGGVVNNEGRKVFPWASFRDLVDRFEQPQLSEGFSRVMNVKFQWMGSVEKLEIWRKYWI